MKKCVSKNSLPYWRHSKPLTLVCDHENGSGRRGSDSWPRRAKRQRYSYLPWAVSVLAIMLLFAWDSMIAESGWKVQFNIDWQVDVEEGLLQQQVWFVSPSSFLAALIFDDCSLACFFRRNSVELGRMSTTMSQLATPKERHACMKYILESSNEAFP
jgi:hypothetical protein